MKTNIAIIGAGPAGLTVARALKQRNIAFEVFEKHSDVGGIWDINNPGTPMYESAHFISSKTMSHFAGYPMPADYPDYPSNRQLLAYIRAFARDHGLLPQIRFNTVVKEAKRNANGWTLNFGDGTTKDFTHLISAVGTNWTPNRPSIPGNFSGKLIHSVEYKSSSDLKGKSVLVIGAGNSGCDIACDVARSADRAFISLRRGYHFIPKHIFGKPADVFAAEGPHLPLWLTQKVFGVLLRLLTGDVTRLGLPKPDHKLLESHPIMNDQILHHLRHGDLRVKPDVARFDGKDVVFKDGSREAIDLVITATGYSWPIPFIDRSVFDWSGDRPKLFLNMLSPKDAQLFVAGFLEVNGGGYKHFDAMADTIASTIALETSDPVKHQYLRKIAESETPDISGGIKLVASDRHVNYADSDAYKAALKAFRKRMGWPEFSDKLLKQEAA
ncbi:MAG: flavin-containing monooxygenase [Rhizobiaceae bacterium]